MATTTSKWATGPTRSPSVAETTLSRWQRQRQSRRFGQWERRRQRRKWFFNQILLGSGTDDVTIQGSQNTITGSGAATPCFLGPAQGTPSPVPPITPTSVIYPPPSSWHGTPASYFHDTLTNCTVVSHELDNHSPEGPLRPSNRDVLRPSLDHRPFLRAGNAAGRISALLERAVAAPRWQTLNPPTNVVATFPSPA